MGDAPGNSKSDKISFVKINLAVDLHLAQGTENEGVSRVSFGFFLTKVGDLIKR